MNNWRSLKPTKTLNRGEGYIRQSTEAITMRKLGWSYEREEVPRGAKARGVCKDSYPPQQDERKKGPTSGGEEPRGRIKGKGLKGI